MVSKRTSNNARKLMRKNPGMRYQQALNELRSETHSSPTHYPWFDALGIADLATFDPRPTWEAGEFDPHFRFLVGHQPDDMASVVDIDLGESSVGGTGPHACIQGITGSGKSVLLTGLVLGACARYSPSKLNFVLMDFKGSHTFRDFAQLPHVLANCTHLQDRAAAVRQVTEAIAAEIERREALMTQYQVSGIVDYRAKRAAAPELYPPLPELAVVVDEVSEFIREHDEFERFLGRLVTVGRSLGIHLILGSQIMRQREFFSLIEHFTCRISLRVGVSVHSQFLLDVDDAARLPIGWGAALMRSSPNDDLVAFNSFNASFNAAAPIPDVDNSVVRQRDALLRRLSSYTVDDPGDRTLADALADLEMRHPYQSR